MTDVERVLMETLHAVERITHEETCRTMPKVRRRIQLGLETVRELRDQQGRADG